MPPAWTSGWHDGFNGIPSTPYKYPTAASNEISDYIDGYEDGASCIGKHLVQGELFEVET